MDQFGSTLNLGHIQNMKDLESVNRTYQEELSRVLNHLAPEKTKYITRKEKRPRFDEDISSLRRVLRRSEKIWMRIRSENSWSVYKQIRKQYQDKLMKKKREKIIMKIEECGSDSKRFFLLVNHLTGHKLEIPLPTRR